jgi:hypothetical protein
MEKTLNRVEFAGLSEGERTAEHDPSAVDGLADTFSSELLRRISVDGPGEDCAPSGASAVSDMYPDELSHAEECDCSGGLCLGRQS